MNAKRPYGGSSSAGSNGPKRSRAGTDSEDEGPSFEDELRMMDGMLSDNMIEDMGGEGELTAEQQEARWMRPPVPDGVDLTEEALQFQWMEIDTTIGPPLAANPAGGDIKGSLEGPVPIIRLYGVTKQGRSVMLSVHGFTPYFYVSLPPGTDISETRLGQLRSKLDESVKSKARGDERKLNTCVIGVQRVPNKQSLLGYHFDTTKDFIKVYVAMPSMIAGLRRTLEMEGVKVGPESAMYKGQTYESNVPYPLRFMIDHNIQGSDWLELPPKTFSVRNVNEKVTRCTIEADIYHDQLIVHPCEGQWSAIAPLRVLSFDIECMGRKGHFPEADTDPVIQIANTVTLQVTLSE